MWQYLEVGLLEGDYGYFCMDIKVILSLWNWWECVSSEQNGKGDLAGLMRWLSWQSACSTSKKIGWQHPYDNPGTGIMPLIPEQGMQRQEYAGDLENNYTI